MTRCAHCAHSNLKVIVAGVGGQGVVFATRLLAQTAVALGCPVIVSETHGMSQRGGSVISHLNIGSSEAPLIQRGTADVLLALEPNEAMRSLPFLRRGGVAFVNAENGWRSAVTSHLERLDIQVLSLPAESIAIELGSAGVTNMVLIGFAIAHPLVLLPPSSIRKVLEDITRRDVALNLQALEAGLHLGKTIGSGAVSHPVQWR